MRSGETHTAKYHHFVLPSPLLAHGFLIIMNKNDIRKLNNLEQCPQRHSASGCFIIIQPMIIFNFSQLTKELLSLKQSSKTYFDREIFCLRKRKILITYQSSRAVRDLRDYLMFTNKEITIQKGSLTKKSTSQVSCGTTTHKKRFFSLLTQYFHILLLAIEACKNNQKLSCSSFFF